QYSYTLAHTCTSMPPVGGAADGFSWTGFSAQHFEVAASGTGPDNAVAQHVQGFYVIGPPDDTDCD
ncbi:MAG: hypothetical protein M3P52_10725, partial [Actinomycetota bacterium]|nr:hypothetical protein [Actinomycetota bacterium]